MKKQSPNCDDFCVAYFDVGQITELQLTKLFNDIEYQRGRFKVSRKRLDWDQREFTVYILEWMQPAKKLLSQSAITVGFLAGVFAARAQ